MSASRFVPLQLGLSVIRRGSPRLPTVILIHDVGSGSAETWPDSLIDALTPGHDIVRYDQRGHGRSSRPVGEHGITDLADDLDALIGQLELGRVDLIGHGVGAMVALEQCWSRPHTVRRVVVADLSFDDAATDPSEDPDDLATGTDEPSRTDAFGVDRRPSESDPGGDLADVFTPSSQDLHQIAPPTMVATSNRAGVAAAAELLIEAIPRARRCMVGSDQILSDPVFNSLLLGFLAEPLPDEAPHPAPLPVPAPSVAEGLPERRGTAHR